MVHEEDADQRSIQIRKSPVASLAREEMLTSIGSGKRWRNCRHDVWGGHHLTMCVKMCYNDLDPDTTDHCTKLLLALIMNTLDID